MAPFAQSTTRRVRSMRKKAAFPSVLYDFVLFSRFTCAFVTGYGWSHLGEGMMNRFCFLSNFLLNKII